MNRIHVDIRPQLPLLFGLVLVAGYLLITIVALARSSYDIAAVFLVVPVLAALSVPMLSKAQRTEPDPWIGRLFVLGMLAMVSMGLIHFFVSLYFYRGGDARLYSAQGAVIGAQFWQGNFVPHLDKPLVGNGFVYLLTGIIYAFIGPTSIGGYVAYSWLGFWGLYFCYRAFRTAMPEADHRRYAVLIFFLPSILFWSSGISKEAWMILCIGLVLLGTARLLSSTTRWVLPLLAGLAGTALVRPHVTALLVAGLLAGVLIRRDTHPTLLSPIVRVLSLVVVVVAGAIVISTAASFLKLETLSVDSVTGAIDKVQRNHTELGNSAFTAHSVKSPLDLPGAVITVLFRPLPWEARNLLILATSVESLLFMVFVALSWRRWRQVPRLLRRYPYITAVLVTILLFIIAFSAVGNFGILVRQRVTIMPLVLVPLCLARRTPATTSDASSPSMERVVLR